LHAPFDPQSLHAYCPLVLSVIVYILTSLAVLHVHRDIDIDIDIVMRSFTLGKSRHIDFGYGH
jgi:hypothetical protein